MADHHISLGPITLEGQLTLPLKAVGIVIFAHGSGSGRFSPRNQAVAKSLNKRGIGTLLCDLLTEKEAIEDEQTAALRFDIPMLADRVVKVTDWTMSRPETKNLSIGYFGASTGAAAALIAAAQRDLFIKAVVSRGGRPDLAEEYLPRVKAPTLLIVGGNDEVVIELNKAAFSLLKCTKDIQIVPGATHLFEERGALEEVSRLAGDWFLKCFS